MAVDTTGVLAGKTVTAITAGGYHTCAVADGKAYCWGYNGNGQLGNNSTTDSSVPVAVNTAGVLAGKTVTAITAGGVPHVCGGRRQGVLLGLQRVRAAGQQQHHRLVGAGGGGHVRAAGRQDGHRDHRRELPHVCGGRRAGPTAGATTATGSSATTAPPDSTVPVAVNTTGPLAGKTVTAITAGACHSCAVAEGRASCWGYNGHGQLGNNSTTDSSVPVRGEHRRGAGRQDGHRDHRRGDHTCAVADGRASCWGYNGVGQLGNNSTTNASVPVAVDTDGAAGRQDGHRDHRRGARTSAVLAAAVPQPPTAVAGVAGDAKVTVSWTAPADDGGSPVLEYVATAIPGGASCTTSSTSCVVSGLANGTGYTFTVTARNAIGISAPSAPSAPVHTPTAARCPRAR